MAELTEAWAMSNEANLFLLSALPKGSLGDRYRPRARTVGEQFAHMHSVRLRWLEHAAPRFAKGVEALDKKSLSVAKLRRSPAPVITRTA